MNARCSALLVWCSVLIPQFSGAQNLVPNRSFEEFEDCPDNAGQIERANGWLARQGSPEYFNQCSTDEWASVPANKVGHQVPHDGIAYAGIITYSDSNWFWAPELLREHITRPLSEPLVPGIPVYVSVWISPAAFVERGVVKWVDPGALAGEFRTYLERAMSQRMHHHKSQGSPSYGAWASVSYRQVEGPLSLSLSTITRPMGTTKKPPVLQTPEASVTPKAEALEARSCPT